MNLYQFVVDFIGVVPEQFEFIYVILTLIISISIFGTFSSLMYVILRIVKGAL